MGAACRVLWLLALAGAASQVAGSLKRPLPNCDGKFEISGNHGGNQILIPTGWKNTDGYPDALVEKNAMVLQMGARAYFADTCSAGKYNNTDYMRANLLGKTLRWSTDMSGVGCGCNAAFYMTSMGHNPHVSECFDHYCDANNVCGQSCAEIDIMEANRHAWHSTLHTKTDNDGAASGFGGGGSGWNGPRDWTEKEYGVGGSCIDTAKPFDAAVSFPIDRHGTLVAMQVTLSQKGHKCKLQARVDDYKNGTKALTHALLDGMTPMVSYWADDDMLWLDGAGNDRKGPCKRDNPKKCADEVRFYDFRIEDLSDEEQKGLEEAALKQSEDMAKKYGGGSSSGSEGGNEWWHPDQQSGSSDGESGNKWWHPDELAGRSSGHEGGNQWWHPDQQKDDKKKVAGTDDWDGSSSGHEGGNKWWHPDQQIDDKKKVAGSDKWDGSSSGHEGGNQWWHPDRQSDDKKFAGSDEWDGGSSSHEGGNKQRHPDRQSKNEKKVRGSGDQDGKDVHELHEPGPKYQVLTDGKVVAMRKDEVLPGLRRGTTEASGARIAPFIGAAVVAGALTVAAVAVAVRRAATSSGGDAGAAAASPSSGISSLGGRPSLRRLRGSFGSLGDLVGLDTTGGLPPMPMLQQPASTQNLMITGSLDTQAA